MTLEQTQAAGGSVSAMIDAGFPLVAAAPTRPARLSFLLRHSSLRGLARVISLLALDYIGLAGALFTTLIVRMVIRGQVEPALAWRETDNWIAFAYLVTVLMFARVELYSDRYLRRGLTKIAPAVLQVSVVSVLFALASGRHFSSYYLLFGSLAFGTVYISGLRAIHQLITGWLLERAGYNRRTLLIGSGRQLEAVARALGSLRRPEVKLVGYLSPSASGPPLAGADDRKVRCLGGLEELRPTLATDAVQAVILADPELPQEDALELVDLCHRSGVAVQVAPSTMEVLMERSRFVPGQSVPLFTLRPPLLEGIDFALKRLADLTLATLGLLLLTPVLLVIAVAVKVTSRGPVIYRSIRPGIGGRPFHCFKFRTMREHAEQLQADLESLNEQSGALFKIRCDPRVTPIGRALRRFSLDELPQLFNVVRGEMSLVGPRPLPVRDFERLEEWHKKRYLVLPGITGLWQVTGRSELDFDELVRLDFLYLERWSILLDFWILIKTIPAVLSRRGAF